MDRYWRRRQCPAFAALVVYFTGELGIYFSVTIYTAMYSLSASDAGAQHLGSVQPDAGRLVPSVAPAPAGALPAPAPWASQLPVELQPRDRRVRRCGGTVPVPGWLGRGLV